MSISMSTLANRPFFNSLVILSDQRGLPMHEAILLKGHGMPKLNGKRRELDPYWEGTKITIIKTEAFREGLEKESLSIKIIIPIGENMAPVIFGMSSHILTPWHAVCLRKLSLLI